MSTKTPKIALGAWSWGIGAAGGEQVFGNHLSEKELRPVFEKAMECGLNLWDTAVVYGEGTSEQILGSFVKDVRRGDVMLSTKFTPHLIPLAKSGQVKMIGVTKAAFFITICSAEGGIGIRLKLICGLNRIGNREVDNIDSAGRNKRFSGGSNGRRRAGCLCRCSLSGDNKNRNGIEQQVSYTRGNSGNHGKADGKKTG